MASPHQTRHGHIRETVYNTAMERLGPTTRKHRNRFDKKSTEIMQLLEDKRCAYRTHLDDPRSITKKDVLRNVRRSIQLKLGQMIHG